jgi:Ca2+-binding RTX toxin-like protein
MTSTWTVGFGGNFATIQEAIDNVAVQDGDKLILSSGVFDEDVVFSKALTIEGAKAGLDGTDGSRSVTGFNETTLIGHHSITASGPVIIDGVRFLNDSSTTGGGSTNPILKIANGNDHVITNSIFYSEVQGGADGVDDRAISMGPVATGKVIITDNYFTGAHPNAFGTASWGRGIWVDGGGVEIDITGNTLEYTRTGINADVGNSSDVAIENNSFSTAGTAISGGVDVDTLSVVDNNFENVGTDFNFRNLTNDVTFDADVAVETVVTTFDSITDRVVVLGGSGNDTLSGTENADFIDGNNHPTLGSSTDADTLSGRGGDDFLHGRAGDDVLDGGAGNDTIGGGAGNDTAAFSGDFDDYDFSAFNGTSGSGAVVGPDGTDTLLSIEAIKFADGFHVIEGMSIQAAIDAASDGDTIYVHAGTYNESLSITKDGITLMAIGDVVLQGNLLNQLGVPSGVPLNDYFEAYHPAYAGSDGIVLNANDVTISGLTITGFSVGISLHTSADASITDNTFIDVINGIRKSEAAQVSNLAVNDNTFTQGVLGLSVYAHASGSGTFDGITMNNNTFSHLSEKGMYFEQLSNANLEGNTFEDVGNYGRISPPFGGVDGEFGQAIDLNLKYGTYESVTFTDTTITNSGNSNKDGAASPGAFGGAIGIKTRDDGSYSGNPAAFTGAIVFDGLTIDGTSTGVRVGEPGKNNLGPDVEITDLSIANATGSDVDNATHPTNGGTLTVELADGQANLDASASQAPVQVTGNSSSNVTDGGSGDDSLQTSNGDDTLNGDDGNDSLDGGSGADTLNGGSGDDDLVGGEGNDAIDGGAGVDTVIYSDALTAANFNTANDEWTITSTDGVDTVVNAEVVEHADGKILLVGNGGYATIQEAVTAAAAGDTIMVAADTYSENLLLNGKGLHFVAVGGEVIIESAAASTPVVTLTGDHQDFDTSFTGGFTFTGATGAGSGIYIDTTAVNIGTLTFDDVNVTGNGGYGIFANTADIEAVNITNSTFSNNATNGINSGAHIKLFAFTGDALIENVTIDGAADGTAQTARPDYGIEFHGIENAVLSGNPALLPDMGNVTINNVTISGEFHKTAVAFNNYGDIGGLSIDGLDLSNAEAFWGVGDTASYLFNMDGISDNIDLSDYNVTFNGSHPFAASLRGEHGSQAALDQTIDGGAGNDRLLGHGGNDTITGGGGDDSIDGGAGTDIAVFSGDFGDYDFSLFNGATGSGTVSGTDGSDTLSSVEAIKFDDGFRVIEGMSIQAAIDAASDGDTIYIEAGTYNESFVVDKGVSIIGVGQVTIQGTFETVNGITGSVADFFTTAGGYTNVGTGIEIQASNVTLSNLTVDGFSYAINFTTDVSNVELNDIEITDSFIGIEKGAHANIDDIRILGGSITDGNIGIDFAKATGVGNETEGLATNVLIEGVHFEDLSAKGIYLEAIAQSTITGVTMEHVAYFGSGPAAGGPWAGVGIELNLKNGVYSDVTITDFTLNDTGASSHPNSAAIAVKTRDDAPSYDSAPATWTGDPIVISNGSIDGTTTGIRAGEVGKNVVGPSVAIENVEFSNVLHDIGNGEVENLSQSPMTVVGTADGDVIFVSPATTGPVSIDGAGGDDIITTTTGPVTVNGGDGVDTVLSAHSLTLEADVENGTLLDGDSNVEDFEDFDLGPIADNENGWNMDGPGNRDQEVVDLGGNKVFRMSSDPASGDYGGPYTPSLTDTAGEPQTTADYNGQTIKFMIKPVSETPDGSRIEVDFGNVQGTDRNSFMVIENTDAGIDGAGIRIAANEPKLDGNWTNNDFSAFDGNIELISGVDPTAWHEIELRLTYLDGPDNDLIEVYLDGKLIGTTTTFENYRDAIVNDHAANAEANQTSRFLFRAGGAGQPLDGPGGQNQGFYFDDVSYVVYNEGQSLTGNALSNVLTGNSGNNVISGLGGNDTIDGGAGYDKVVYSGDWTDYTVTSGSSLTIAHKNGGADGTDTVSNVEYFQFDNGTFTAAEILNDAPINLALTGNEVDEGAANDTVVGTLSSSDADSALGDTATYSLVDNADGRFAIVGNKIVVADGSLLDYETATSHQVTVRVTDAGGLYVDETFTIDLNGTPDEAPVVTSTAFNVTEPSTIVGTVTATDADSLQSALTFAITGGANAALFDIDAGTGALTFKSAPDFENDPHQYEIEVTAFDGDNYSAPQLITITLDDANDNAPVITTTAFNVAENKTGVGTVVAEDVDTTGEAITYSISGGDDLSLFAINNVTGALSFLDLQDYEGSQKQFEVEITASDGKNSSKQTVTINLTDVNDVTPVFTSPSTFTVAENETDVGQVTSFDPDTVGAATYSIVGGTHGALFDIDPTSGELSFKSAPDYDTGPHSYSVQVQVSDGVNSSTQNVTVNVTNTNDTAPDFTSATVFTIAENTTAVGTVAAKDDDGDTVTYEITGGADAAKFVIDENSGQLSFVAAPDFESDSEFFVQVTASDGKNSTVQAITVNVTDVNDNAPVISTTSLSVAEGSTVVGKVLASDEDGVGGPITFSLTGGTDQSLFTINTTTGELSLVAPKDFEAGDTQFEVEVQASDGTNSSKKTITVNLTDVGPGTPIDVNAAANTVAEGAAAGTTVGIDIDAADSIPALPTETAIYSIVSDTSNGGFQINSSTGLVTVADGTKLDFETAAQHTIVVQALDRLGGNASTAAFVINLTNVTGNTINGTTKADLINAISGPGKITPTNVATSEADIITGGKGIDTIDGLAGDDIIQIRGTDDSRDIIQGGLGSDTIKVLGTTAVTLNGFNTVTSSIEKWEGNGKGVVGSAAADIFDFSNLDVVNNMGPVNGGKGDDTITGSKSADDLRGGAGNDTLNGGDGNDTLLGGAGLDKLNGGDGDDTILLVGTSDTNDILDGGAGTDKVQVTASVTLSGFNAATSSIEEWVGTGKGILGTTGDNVFDFSGLTSVTKMGPVNGGAGNDTITGSKVADDLRGAAGNDTLNGGDGNDTLSGGAGLDTINGGDGDDTILLAGTSDTNDILNGGAGTDKVQVTASVTLNGFNATASSIEQWVGTNKGILGTSGDNVFNFSGLTSVTNMGVVDAGAGNDTLIGSSFADKLRGGAGDDTLDGGQGNDTLTGGAGIDTFVYKTGSGADVVTDYVAGVDKFDLQGVATSFADLMSHVSSATAQGVVFDFGTGDTLTISKATLALLNANASDFTFS